MRQKAKSPGHEKGAREDIICQAGGMADVHMGIDWICIARVAANWS